MTAQDIRQRLLVLASRDHKEFTAALCPGVSHILGIRVPQLRALASEVARADWRSFVTTAEPLYMEERMLVGMVLGLVRVPDVEDYLALVSRFVRLINSWAVCDCFHFAGRDRFVRAHTPRVWQYLEEWLRSRGEYEVRFGVVQMMNHFSREPHVGRTLELLSGADHPGHYARMAVAWAVSTCYVHSPAPTLALLRQGALEPWTHNKAIQKICESLRVPPEDKRMLKTLRR